MSVELAMASDIWELIEDECEANKNYTKFLAKYGSTLPEMVVSQIEEIISEEHKHVCMLADMVQGITGIAPKAYESILDASE